MRVWSLSSGSSGNCYLVQEGDSLLLLDAGLGVRRVLQELANLNLSRLSFAGIYVSHEHGDHWSSAAVLARRLRAPILCTGGTWLAAPKPPFAVDRLTLASGAPTTVGPFSLDAFSVPHDAAEPVGVSINGGGRSLCLATDLGIAGDALLERAGAADLVILEANHDIEMLKRGPYPAHLKKRILGPRGHLSNPDAARAIVKLAGARPRQFWLAHLSNANNSPRTALTSVKDVLRGEGLDQLRVDVALRDRRSLFWDSEDELEQLTLF